MRVRVAAGPVLIGVDVVAVARVARLLERHGDRVHRTIAGPTEARWASGAVRVAALFAVKEAVVKALSGRPAGFRWTQIEVRPSTVDHPVLDAFAAGVGAVGYTGVRVELAGGCRTRLGGPPAEAVGRWGERDGHVFAAVVMVP